MPPPAINEFHETRNWPWLPQGFATTRWSLLKRVTAREDLSGPSPDEFCRLYWQPLYSFLRRRGYREAESQDHVQSFLLKVIAERLLEKADPGRGRFRAYLTTLLTRHVFAVNVRDRAQKRGGGGVEVPFDWVSAEQEFLNIADSGDTPDDVLRRALAVRLVNEALVLLRERCREAAPARELLEELIPALEGPLVDSSYQSIAVRFGLTTGAVRCAVLRVRARFRKCLREAASTAFLMPESPALDEELRDLFR